MSGKEAGAPAPQKPTHPNEPDDRIPPPKALRLGDPDLPFLRQLQAHDWTYEYIDGDLPRWSAESKKRQEIYDGITNRRRFLMALDFIERVPSPQKMRETYLDRCIDALKKHGGLL